MGHWATESIFYHIYPLGFCGAPQENDFTSQPISRLEAIYPWIDHMKQLGVNAMYLGPVFESGSHGYDTADYFHVDRRLGTEETLVSLVAELHRQNIRVVFDAVFNHVGRGFWAFRDLQANREQSRYRNWFQGLRFDAQNPFGDPFTYEGWFGHLDLVKLNLRDPDVKSHLLQAAKMWIQRFDIDGLRLDAAESMDLDFLHELGGYCRLQKPDFWMMGEVVAGDYQKWLQKGGLDSVTNYEAYKGLYSSHVDKNYFEIAYALNREFGKGGLFCQIPLYNFADNHDVNRVASMLRDPGHLYPLYCLLFTMPGVPSIYYGSEWGIEGKKVSDNDAPLRPQLDLSTIKTTSPHPDLADVIARLAAIRHSSLALKRGDYFALEVRHEQLAFSRRMEGDRVVVAVNAASRPATLQFTLPGAHTARLRDLLNPGDQFEVRNGKVHLDAIPPHWGRILRVES